MKPFSLSRTTFSIGVFLTCILPASDLFGQRGTNSQATYQVLRINNNIVRIENLSYSDALGAGGVMTHTASFSSGIYADDPGTASLLSFLQRKNMKELRADASFSILTVNTNLEIQEQRDYTGVTVQEFSLSALDGTQNTAVKVSVKITAANLNLLTQKGMITLNTFRTKPANSNNFSLSLGNLPCNRVIQISPLFFKPVSGNGFNFTIMVSQADAQAWNQAFLNGTARGLQGSVSLLMPDMKAMMKTITITNAQVTSFTITGNGGKAQVGINAANISIQ